MQDDAARRGRFVTGHTAGGKSTIIADGQPPSDASAPDRYLWTTGGTPADNRGDADAAIMPLRLEPPASGSGFRIVQFPPQSALAGLSTELKQVFFQDLFAGMDAAQCQVDTARSPGMHKTSTIDYVVVLRGEVTLLLDEAEATLKAGDFVVQRGTNHEWVVPWNRARAAGRSNDRRPACVSRANLQENLLRSGSHGLPGKLNFLFWLSVAYAAA